MTVFELEWILQFQPSTPRCSLRARDEMTYTSGRWSFCSNPGLSGGFSFISNAGTEPRAFTCSIYSLYNWADPFVPLFPGYDRVNCSCKVLRPSIWSWSLTSILYYSHFKQWLDLLLYSEVLKTGVWLYVCSGSLRPKIEMFCKNGFPRWAWWYTLFLSFLRQDLSV